MRSDPQRGIELTAYYCVQHTFHHSGHDSGGTACATFAAVAVVGDLRSGLTDVTLTFQQFGHEFRTSFQWSRTGGFAAALGCKLGERSFSFRF